MAEPNALPSEQQRVWLENLLHWAFIEMRLLGWEGKAAQCADLADALHNLPTAMHDPGHGPWQTISRQLSHYCEKYKGARPTGYNYVRAMELIAAGEDPNQHFRLK